MGTQLTLDIKEAYMFGNKLLAEHGLLQQGWRFDLSNRKKHVGHCNYNRKTVYYSVHYLGESLEEIADTILHEIAHALTPDDKGHGYEWRAKCVEIGAKPERLAHEIETKITPNYEIKCPECGWSVTRLRMRQRNFGSTCPQCGTEVVIYRIRREQ
jgi:predicted SprT family Zn-dependent metalloprotease